MKRVLASIFSVLFLITLVPEKAMAYSTAAETSADTEMEEVAWILENGTFVTSEIKTITTDNQEELVFNVDTYAVTEKIEDNQAELIGRSISGENYKHTTYQLWRAQPRIGGTSMQEEYDDSYSIYFRLTVNYTDITYNELVYRRITDVSGLYSIEDSQMTVTEHSYLVGQTGRTYPSGSMSDNYLYTLTVPLYTWTRTVSSTDFPPIRMRDELASQGVIYYYTIERIPTGSTWSGQVNVTTVGGLYDVPEA